MSIEKSFKAIHISDIHWRGLSRHDEYIESFTHFFNQATELGPDVIYVGGDIVHSKTQGISPELIDALCWWFTGLANIAPVHVILGNHDGLMMNKDRQDAITPILTALNNDNIFLYKESGVYPTGVAGFNWCVFSCFDEAGWENVAPIKDDINIALFHGGVLGSTTDIDWDIEGEITVDFFEEYDYAMIGDIHKAQILDSAGKIRYSGSSIQQNYGESTGKGFLFWEIRSKDDFDVEFYEIPHNKPFITVDWVNTVSETLESAYRHPDGSRFRIRSKNVITQTDSKQLQYNLNRVKQASEVVFKSDSVFDVSKIATSAGMLNKENLRDAKTHKKLLRDFYTESKLTDDSLDLLYGLVDSYISQITDENESFRNTRWQINSLKFDNLFAYGSGNIVNFDNLPGITGIFGKNAKGKSSIIGAAMYGLFNTTDRGSIKNVHIINNRKNKCFCEVDFSVNSDRFKIERSTVKHQTKKGEIYASTALNLYRIDSEGVIVEDLTEEQRRETEKTIRKIIGTSEDFLMTSLASQGEMNTFIKEGATSRKMILTKFLDLAVFEKMHDIAKSESYDLRNRTKLFPDIDWVKVIDEKQSTITSENLNFKEVASNIQKKREILNDLNINLAMSDNPDTITRHELTSQERVVDRQQKEIDEFRSDHKASSTSLSEMIKRNEEIDILKRSYSIEELQDKLEIEKQLDKSLTSLKHKYEIQNKEFERQEKSIRKLSEVPCGDSFPTCKFIKDSHNDKLKIKKHKELVESTLSDLDDIRKTFNLVKKEKIREKINKYESLVRDQSSTSIKISDIRLKLSNIESDIRHTLKDLNDEIHKLDEMKLHVVEDEDSNPASLIRSRIVTLNDDIKKLERKSKKILEKIAENKVNVSKLKSDRIELETIKDKVEVYDLFMHAVSKKGIPLQIMMSQLPLINSEISKILLGVIGFTVELEADIDSNAMDVYIDYGDSKRVIELAAGMEKMMASLAIRVALINVSSLTKTNMLIIDEGFGALDELNIEACSRLLESLKKWFRNIIVISHVDAIKDAVDNSLDIVKNEKDSKVCSF